jgi:hypothetical protein
VRHFHERDRERLIDSLTQIAQKLTAHETLKRGRQMLAKRVHHAEVDAENALLAGLAIIAEDTHRVSRVTRAVHARAGITRRNRPSSVATSPRVHNQRKKDGCYGSLASGVQACLNQVPLEIDKIHSHFTGTPRASCRGCARSDLPCDLTRSLPPRTAVRRFVW